MDKNFNNLDIVIVNYNSKDYLLRCLKSIFHSKETPPANIYIQNNSPEEKVESVISEFPKAKVTKSRMNLGFAKAVNLALDQGEAPYVVLLNPDTYIFDGFFQKAMDYMEENPDVAIVGPKIVDDDGQIQGSARRFPNPLTGLFGRNTFLSKIFPNNKITCSNILTKMSDGKTPMEVDWVSGACLVARRKAVEEVGYLDERFFMYWEDADWCRRMREKEWKVVYFPKATIAHHVGGSSSTRRIQSRIAFHKSCYKLFTKYNKSYLRFLNPFVMVALFIRLICAISLNGLSLWYRKIRTLLGKKDGSRVSIVNEEVYEE